MRDKASGYDLAVAYRICPGVSNTVGMLPFGGDKYLLSEVCLRSFKESLGDLRVKIWVLLDGCPVEYQNLFRKYFPPDDLVLIAVDSLGNQATFGRQIDILLAQQASDLIYFAEDDYFYLPGQFRRMVEFLMSNQDADFITAYDHLDCYTLDLHRFPKFLRVSGNYHWRTAASTCLTFLTRKEVLRKCEAAFRSYCRGNYDCSLWLSLTKHSVFNPVRALRYAVHERWLGKILAKSWFNCWRQILFGRRRQIWVPVPGIATHLNANALSPAIDWATLIRLQKEHIDSDQIAESSSSTMRSCS